MPFLSSARRASCRAGRTVRAAWLSTAEPPPPPSAAAGAAAAPPTAPDAGTGSRTDMAFQHWRPRFHGARPKFKSPRRRASALYQDLTQEEMARVRAARPEVHGVPFRVGDAIEVTQVAHGGVNATDKASLEKVRGVVLGRFNKGLDTTVLLRDVLFGFPVERRIPLFSPLLRSLKVLEPNFVFKGKRRVKRAKLYYLRDRNPVETRVTKW